jgi:K+-sensing histidine kinase KdpD
VSRLERGLVPMRLEDVDPNTVVLAATSRAVLAAESGGVTIDAAPDLPLVRADRQRLEDVLTDLIAHAGRLAPGAPVALGVRQQVNALTIAVHAHETRLTAAEVATLNDPFSRTGARIEPRMSLSALELARARATLQAMDSDLSIEEEQPRMLALVLRLPLATSAGPAGPAPLTPPHRRPVG